MSLPALLLAAAAAASAAVPGRVTFQGNLRQNGILVTGSRDMTFSLYASSTAAAALWTSAVTPVAVSTGVFRALLEPSGIDWETPLWLETSVEGTALSPRHEFTATPYAVNALLHSGKRYTSAAAAPASPGPGDLWYDSSGGVLKFWNGSWTASGGGAAVAHASTHAGSGVDPLTSLGGYTLTGNIAMSAGTSLGAGPGSAAVSVSTNLVVGGSLELVGPTGTRLGFDVSGGMIRVKANGAVIVNVKP